MSCAYLGCRFDNDVCLYCKRKAPMSHIEVLNEMLAHCCPNEEHEDGSKSYYLEAHCANFKIRAKLINTSAAPPFKYEYEILSFERERT